MLIFTDELLIGNGQIDTEHKMLFDMINNAHKQISEENGSVHNAVELIQNLENYAETHFLHEEEYMKKINDPEYSIQKCEHDIFRSKISEYRNVKIENEKEAELILEELLTYLAKWLYRHILSSDTLIGKVTVMEEEEINEVFDFSAKYQSGIDFIDKEHKKLFALIKKLYILVHGEGNIDDTEHYDRVMEVVEELGEYTKYHFTHEEEYMEKINYPFLKEQRLAHQAFIYKIQDAEEDVLQNDKGEFLKDLVDFLIYWLTNHILKFDLLIVGYC